ncbi:hypothetical protein [Zhaonella formicivorans]|jgi:hypothetical protein|nr:hypothetical protein [Zhaonella formicivorans]
MTQLLQKTAGGLAFVYSGVLTASFAVAGLMSLISVAAVVAGLFGAFN